MVYWLRESAIQILHVCEEDSELFNHFATFWMSIEHTKTKTYEKLERIIGTWKEKASS